MAPLKILALNAGSSTLKASLFELSSAAADGVAPVGKLWESDTPWGGPALERGLAPLWTGKDAILTAPADVDAIGHRVVHGGTTLRESTLLSPAVIAEVARVAEYAPVHNAAALHLIREAQAIFGKRVPQVAVFDTAFHRTLAPAAFTYAGPSSWVEQGIRRFGFHGISHQYASHRAAHLLGTASPDFRVVSCHLGSGCSLAAVRGGASVDTTMGFTPLDGLPMARRSGAIDPGILIHLLRHSAYTIDALDHLLNEGSGLAGLSGTSGDVREVLVRMDAGDDRSRLAFDVFVHRTRQEIGAMAASLGGLDALVFTGGIGEHAPRVREAICAPFGFLGVAVDARRNAGCTGEGELSAAASRVKVLVVPAQENWMVAREGLRVAGGSRGS